jgi:hypothetical protein
MEWSDWNVSLIAPPVLLLARRVLLASAADISTMSVGGGCCSDAAEDLAIEQFVTQFTIEAFAIAVLPWASR